MPNPIRHAADRSRFESSVDGHLCRADYLLADGVMELTHTEVAAAVEGRGVGGELIEAALDHARAQGLKVRPLCSFARRYMDDHPETAALRA
ncbi:MAG: GNAT family N-acetyltransferase [Caldimonas sp.]